MKTLTKMTILLMTMSALTAQANMKLNCVATAGNGQAVTKQVQAASPATTALVAEIFANDSKYSFVVETYPSGQVGMQIEESKNGEMVNMVSSISDINSDTKVNPILEGFMSKLYVHLTCIK